MEEGGEHGSSIHYIHESGSFVPLVQVRQTRAMTLHETTDAKALMEVNGGVYDIEQDPLWNGEGYDDIPIDNRSDTHPWCGETEALSVIAHTHNVSSADELREIVQGGTSTTVRNDGKLKPYCKSCKVVMGRLGVGDGVKE